VRREPTRATPALGAAVVVGASVDVGFLGVGFREDDALGLEDRVGAALERAAEVGAREAGGESVRAAVAAAALVTHAGVAEGGRVVLGAAPSRSSVTAAGTGAPLLAGAMLGAAGRASNGVAAASRVTDVLAWPTEALCAFATWVAPAAATQVAASARPTPSARLASSLLRTCLPFAPSDGRVCSPCRLNGHTAAVPA